ncbi:unnamed protein product [Prorocentrum cordatum]|uniref:BRCT domain-containing protein n=1 Tax=Prorocentrum cordatum TaxID=2364126 RepID=A0ABN9W4S8_9DINO|nr:unnamed protein product [Polarella glacialis]
MTSIRVTLPTGLRAQASARRSAYMFLENLLLNDPTPERAAADAAQKVVPEGERLYVLLTDAAAADACRRTVAAIGGEVEVLTTEDHNRRVAHDTSCKKVMEAKEQNMATAAQAVQFGTEVARLAANGQAKLAQRLASIAAKSTAVTSSGLSTSGMKKRKREAVDEDRILSERSEFPVRLAILRRRREVDEERQEAQLHSRTSSSGLSARDRSLR